MSLHNTHYGKDAIREMLRGARHYHFIGIGGVSMSSLARLTRHLGYAVSGSDRTATNVTRRLSEEGICVYSAHAAENLQDADAVVYTVAISEENPEYTEAVRRRIPLISRADYMGYLMSVYPCRIGISGMHGKSSTTSMCAQILMDAGVDPTVFSGAEMQGLDGSLRIGSGKDFLFEACEYQDSFLDFCPTVAVILNVEMDHVDYFHSMEQVRTSFGKFADLSGADGICIVCADDENAMRSVSAYRGRLVTFSVYGNGDVTAKNVTWEHGCASFDIYRGSVPLCRAALKVPGKHQIANALAAAAACDAAGISGKAIGCGLSAFPGAKRRMEYKGRFCGAEVYDDYGHHPTEVATTLKAARDMGFSHLYCVFQSHTYSRTAGLWDEFLTAFSDTDGTWIAPIYAARETDTLGVTPQKLADGINRVSGRMSAYAPGGNREILAELRTRLKPGDGLIVMGAGDIYRIFADMGL